MQLLKRTPRIMIHGIVALVMGCGGYGGYGDTAPRAVATVSISLTASTIEVGEGSSAIAVGLDQYGSRVDDGAATYASSDPGVAAINPTSGAIIALSSGAAEISATIGGRTGKRSLTVVTAPIRINEVGPNGDLPGGFVELYNPTAASVDLSGWTITSSDLLHGFVLPAGTTIAGGAFRSVNEANLPAGIRAADEIHLFSRFGVQVDSFAWTVNPATSFGRCADGTGAFVVTVAVTRAAANACPAGAAAVRMLRAGISRGTVFRPGTAKLPRDAA